MVFMHERINKINIGIKQSRRKSRESENRINSSDAITLGLFNIKEEWKDIEGYEGSYQVSNLGNIISFKTGKGSNYTPTGILNIKLMIGKGRNAYLFFHACKNGIKKTIKIHQIVAKHFIPNPNNYKEINHIDGNKLNNCVSNLEWCTRSHNCKESFRLKLHIHDGEKNPKSKLSNKQVLKIRELKNKITQKKIALMFKVSECTINGILKNRTWTNL